MPSVGSRFVFLELFAGNGELSDQVAKVTETLPPQDYHTKNGIDFTDIDAVHSLWQEWRALADQGVQLLFHVAPPCATFSRARDRSHRTRLRSSALPGDGTPTILAHRRETPSLATPPFQSTSW